MNRANKLKAEIAKANIPASVHTLRISAPIGKGNEGKGNEEKIIELITLLSIMFRLITLIKLFLRGNLYIICISNKTNNYFQTKN